MADPVCFSDIFIGMELKDDDGHYCIVKKNSDIHNILVEYKVGTNGGYGFICLDPSCSNFDIAYKV